MKICFTGDSISHGVEVGNRKPRSIGEFMAYQIKGTKIRDICYPSDNIGDQTDRWNQLSSEEKLSFDYIISMNGNNDGLASMKSNYQTFFDMIRSEIKSSCKIIFCTLTPYGGEENRTNRDSMNEYILGNSAPILTGADAYVTEHTTYLDDGTNTVYDYYAKSPVDYQHINEAGLEVVADAVIKKMKELNWI